MDEDLDLLLEREARRQGTSKAALIRACVRRQYRPATVDEDPLTALLGVSDGEPVDDIDAVVYGS